MKRSQLAADFTIGRLWNVPTRLHVQKLIDGVWVTTAHAQNIEAAERHASVVGGQCRAVTTRSGRTVAEWAP